ncbi:hypothetical protein [Palleronia abyssalis]|uniref:Uncharacterized protein n=1 Tax=Palleronia abyssalis TaxID=1501240 RepID=A0A2R8C1D1_9RHOB|nr:hypothetical protein [Palleronia abyssalis]SPJ26202.1 hypothetical protein PAA8504_04058 [Palleronia abyssalis]
MSIYNMLRRPARIAALCASIGLIVSGCVAVPTEAELQATRDECSQFRQPFVAIARERNERIKKWASVGATAGGALGANIARNRGDSPIGGALVGALIGGMAGAGAGYYSDLQRRNSSTSALRGAVNADARRDLGQANQLVRNLSSLNNCRLNQIATVERSVQRGGDRGSAQATLNRIKANVRVDNRIIDGVVGDLQRTRNVYVGALRQTGADTAGFVSSIQRYQPQVSTPQRTALRVNTAARPRTNNPVANLGYVEKELTVGAQANAESVNNRIGALNDLLI